MKFVHCFDEGLKNVLVSKGYKVLQSYKTRSLEVWVFENIGELHEYLQFTNDRRCFLSNKLVF